MRDVFFDQRAVLNRADAVTRFAVLVIFKRMILSNRLAFFICLSDRVYVFVGNRSVAVRRVAAGFSRVFRVIVKYIVVLLCHKIFSLEIKFEFYYRIFRLNFPLRF
jgi:hypothetical protein